MSVVIRDPEIVKDTLLFSDKKDQEVLLTVETEVKLPKTSAFKGVRKLSTLKVAINFNYPERAQAHDPTWKPKESADEAKGMWGKRLGLSCLVEHKGELYVHCWVVESMGYDYFNEAGEVLDKAKVNHELYTDGDKPAGLPVRRFKLSGIKTIELV